MPTQVLLIALGRYTVFRDRDKARRRALAYTIPGNLSDATGLSIPFGTFDGRLPRSI